MYCVEVNPSIYFCSLVVVFVTWLATQQFFKMYHWPWPYLMYLCFLPYDLMSSPYAMSKQEILQRHEPQRPWEEIQFWAARVSIWKTCACLLVLWVCFSMHTQRSVVVVQSHCKADVQWWMRLERHTRLLHHCVFTGKMWASTSSSLRSSLTEWRWNNNALFFILQFIHITELAYAFIWEYILISLLINQLIIEFIN